MADVFISYARQDREWVETLAGEIERAGLSVWWDRQLSYGRSFDAIIAAELEAARAIVVVWSKTAIQSDWVKDEAQAGRQRGVLLPVLKEAIAPPLGFRQAHSADLSRWPDENQREFVKLLAEIGGLTGVDLTPPSAQHEARPRRAAAPPASRRRPRLALAGIAVLLIALLGVTGFWWLTRDDGPQAPPKATPATPPTAPATAAGPTRTLLTTLQTGGGKVSRVSISPDGSRVIAVGDGTDGAYLWDTQSGEEIGRLGSVLEDFILFDQNGDRVATASVDHLQVWDSRNGSALGSAGVSSGALNGAALSAEGRRAVTLSSGAAQLWDVDESRLIATLGGADTQPRSAEYSPDGARILTADGGRNTASIWNAADGALLSTPAGHDNSVLDAHFSPDGSKIVTASEDGTAMIWAAASGERLALLGFHDAGVRQARFSPDASKVLTIVEDGSVTLWRADGTRVARFGGDGGPIIDATFTAAGGHVVGLYRSGTVMVWNAATGAAEAELKSSDGHAPTATALSADGTRVLVARDGTVTVEAISLPK